MESRRKFDSSVRGAAISVACSVALVAGMCPAVALADVQERVTGANGATSVLAQNEAAYSASLLIPGSGTSVVRAGEDFDLAVETSAASGVISCAQIDFSFDASKVQIKEIKAADGIRAESSFDNEKGTGLLTFFDNNTASIQAFVITFTAASDALGDPAIKLTSATAGTQGVTSDGEVAFSEAAISLDIQEAATDISEVGIKAPGAQFYTGSAITPLAGSTKTSGDRIYEGTDYTVTYSNNVGTKGETTTATATVTGIGKYKGTTEITFDIVQYELSLMVDGAATATISRDELLALAESSTDNTEPAYFQYGSSKSSTVIAVPAKKYVTIKALAEYLNVADFTSVKATASDGFSGTTSKETVDNGQFYPAQTSDNVLNAEGAFSTPAVLAIQWDNASLKTGTSMSTAQAMLEDESNDSLVIRILMGATAEDFANGSYAGNRYVSNVNQLDFAAVHSGADGFIERLYRNVLGREADAEGKAAQLEGMRLMGAAQIVYNFYNSEEFKNKSATMTNEEIVENVYQTLLNRPADETGKAMWVEYLNNGMSACALVAGFAEAQEFANMCAGYDLEPGSANQLRTMLEPRDRNAGITAFASRMYTVVLSRAAETDGLNVQCEALINGMPAWQIAVNFFTSEEFMNKHLSGMNIVRTAYQAILGRDAASTEADTEGRMYWHERIHGDSYDVASITDVVKGMCQSDEFENICKSCGMTSGMR